MAKLPKISGTDLKEGVKKASESIVKAAGAVKDSAIPMAKKAEQMAAGAVKTAAKKSEPAAQAVVDAAKRVSPQKPAVFLQYGGREVDVNDLIAQAKAVFKAEYKHTAVLTCRVYLKPEDHAAYYVINDSFRGRLDL